MEVSVFRWLYREHVAPHLGYRDIFNATLTCKAMRSAVDPLLEDVRERFRTMTRKGFCRLAFMLDERRMIDVAIDVWKMGVPIEYIMTKLQFETYRASISTDLTGDFYHFRFDSTSVITEEQMSCLNLVYHSAVGGKIRRNNTSSSLVFTARGLCAGGHLDLLKTIDLSTWSARNLNWIVCDALFAGQWACVDFILGTFPDTELVFGPVEHAPLYNPKWVEIFSTAKTRYPKLRLREDCSLFYYKIANSDESILTQPDFMRTIPNWYSQRLLVRALRTCHCKKILAFLLKNTRRSVHRAEVAKSIRKYSMFKLRHLYEMISLKSDL
jgi:hypothetical protein